MPEKVLNEALYHDRTVQDWHRDNFPSDYWAIDLDLMGVCKRCKKPLYLIESTTNPNKPLSILSQLARELGVPGLMILHNTERILYAKAVGKSGNITQETLELGIKSLRQRHESECCR